MSRDPEPAPALALAQDGTPMRSRIPTAFLLATVLATILGLASCGGDPTHGDPHAAGAATGLRLDDGRKWQTTASTHAAMGAMQQLLDGFVSSGAVDLRALGASLREHTNEIIRTCTMTGEPHHQLHLLLNPMLETIEELVSGRGSTADVEALRKHLTDYFAHFEL